MSHAGLRLLTVDTITRRVRVYDCGPKLLRWKLSDTGEVEELRCSPDLDRPAA